MKKTTFFIFALHLSWLAFGQDFLVKEDLRLNWMYYDASESIMLPFLDNDNTKPVAIHLFVDHDHSPEALLLIEFPPESSLLVDNRFIRSYEEGKRQYFDLDSLTDQGNGQSMTITLYKSRGFEQPVKAEMGFIHTSFDARLNVNPIEARSLDNSQEFLKVIILSIFIFFVVLYVVFPLDLFEFFSINSLVMFRYTDSAFSKYRSITKTQVLVIIFQAALLAGTLLIFARYYYNPFADIFILRINLIFGWLVLFVIVLIAIFLKYVLIAMMSSLFAISDKTNFYFIEYLRMAMIFYTIVFVVISFMIVNRMYLMRQLLEVTMIAVVAFNLIRFVVIYFKFRRTVTIKNLHLFSYLCSTELIPLIIGFKFFLK